MCSVQCGASVQVGRMPYSHGCAGHTGLRAAGAGLVGVAVLAVKIARTMCVVYR